MPLVDSRHIDQLLHVTDVALILLDGTKDPAIMRDRLVLAMTLRNAAQTLHQPERRDLELLLEHYQRLVTDQQQALREVLDAARSHINSVRAVLEARQQ